MRHLLILIVALYTLAGCAGQQSVDWAGLVVDAKPAFEVGECGPQARWEKQLQVSDGAEVVASVVVRQPCDKGKAEGVDDDGSKDQ